MHPRRPTQDHCFVAENTPPALTIPHDLLLLRFMRGRREQLFFRGFRAGQLPLDGVQSFLLRCGGVLGAHLIRGLSWKGISEGEGTGRI